MSNNYYDYQQNILPGGIARSEPIVEEFQRIEEAFELLPDPVLDPNAERGFSVAFSIRPATEGSHPVTYGQFKSPLEPVGRLPHRRVSGDPGFSVALPVGVALAPDHAATWGQVTDPTLPVARLPQRRTSGDPGFAAPLPVGIGKSFDHAATIGQLTQQKSTMQAAEANAVASAAAAEQSELNALGAYSASQSIFDSLAGPQAQINALLGLGIGMSYVNDDGELIMTYNADTVTDISIDGDGFLTITY